MYSHQVSQGDITMSHNCVFKVLFMSQWRRWSGGSF